MGINPETYIFTFGKYEGTHIKDVPESYVYWCIENIEWFEIEEPKPIPVQPFTKEEFKLIRSALHPDRNPHKSANEAFQIFNQKAKVD